jgi:hypothetical protein
MESLADQFLALEPEQRKTVHFVLCEYALQQWNRYAATRKRIRYTESAIGTKQEVDRRLPDEAFEAAKGGLEPKPIENRYLEPITAMQEDDLVFPKHIQFAYYSIYNLFNKYALREPVDDWLIVNQALGSEMNSGKWDARLAGAIESALQP